MFAANDAATQQIGGLIAGMLRPGDLVLLDGDLGAGKTALARAIIRGLTGNAELEVPSPTFLLVLPYAAGTTPVMHADLYRLAEAADLDELGLFDDERAIVLVEWPDRAPDLSARADVIVQLAIPENNIGRTLRLNTPRDPSRLFGVRHALTAFNA